MQSDIDISDEDDSAHIKSQPKESQNSRIGGKKEAVKQKKPPSANVIGNLSDLESDEEEEDSVM